MNNGKRIRSLRDVYKVTAGLGIPNFHYHNIGGVKQKLDGKTNPQFEKRTPDGSRAVSNVKNLQVYSEA